MDYNPRTDLYEDELNRAELNRAELNKSLNKFATNDENELIRLQRETLKNNALFNLDFDEYKAQVKQQWKEQQQKLSNLDYVKDMGAIRQQQTNMFLYIGLTFLIIAIIIVVLNVL
jgi:hypothetical protein